jgi:hypothetical protein
MIAAGGGCPCGDSLKRRQESLLFGSLTSKRSLQLKLALEQQKWSHSTKKKAFMSLETKELPEFLPSRLSGWSSRKGC